MTWLRRLAFIALLIVLMLLAAMFAYSNPQPIDVDIGLVRVEQISMALAFAVVFVCGWLFGLLTAALALLAQRAREAAAAQGPSLRRSGAQHAARSAAARCPLKPLSSSPRC